LITLSHHNTENSFPDKSPHNEGFCLYKNRKNYDMMVFGAKSEVLMFFQNLFIYFSHNSRTIMNKDRTNHSVLFLMVISQGG
ncbi:hypothetical protein HMPREF3293_00443, partial [Christensenella minuta]